MPRAQWHNTYAISRALTHGECGGDVYMEQCALICLTLAHPFPFCIYVCCFCCFACVHMIVHPFFFLLLLTCSVVYSPMQACSSSSSSSNVSAAMATIRVSNTIQIRCAARHSTASHSFFLSLVIIVVISVEHNGYVLSEVPVFLYLSSSFFFLYAY